MENRRMLLPPEEQTLAEVKIQRDIIQRVLLSLQWFVMVIMLLNYISRKFKGDFKFTKLQEKIKHFVCMDDIEVFAKKEKY